MKIDRIWTTTVTTIDGRERRARNQVTKRRMEEVVGFAVRLQFVADRLTKGVQEVALPRKLPFLGYTKRGK